MEFEIILDKLRFYAFHGVFEEERRVGNEFIVNLSVKVACGQEVRADSLEATVSYAELFEIVKEEINKPRNLLEKVALEIADRIREKFCEQIISGRIEIRKVHPPIPGMLGEAGVALNF
ncbi:MAG: dihydroneopterin aldolase [Muribaculaceae bacterium]|nr:dihydroneopterin aldolase [Muribaculaceae bacterium]